MDASTPWMDALQGDLPIVELTNSDLIGLDKGDDIMEAHDFGVIEPLVEITSPVLDNVDNVSESSFCMIEPEVQINASETQMNLSQGEMKSFSSELDWSSSSSVILIEPPVKIADADVLFPTPETQSHLQEPMLVEDLPEKSFEEDPVQRQSNENENKSILAQYGDYNLKEFTLQLFKIDEIFPIIDNSVTLPASMCGSNGSSSSRRLKSQTVPSGSKAKARHERSTAVRSSYSLRIKTEPPDDDDDTQSETVRFNPYALTAQKPAGSKRQAGTNKAKRSKPSIPQPDDGEPDFLPTDFLEASMSEGASPSKPQQPWPTKAAVPAVAERRQSVSLTNNGTRFAALKTTQRLAPVGGGNAEGNKLRTLDTLAKVMANSSISLTHRSKLGKALMGSVANKPPGQTGMVNHDHQYSSRLSNENVTRLEAQIKSLQTENRTLRKETQTLQEKLTAAHTYISTSLQGASVSQPRSILPSPARPRFQRWPQLPPPMRPFAARGPSQTAPQRARGQPQRVPQRASLVAAQRGNFQVRAAAGVQRAANPGVMVARVGVRGQVPLLRTSRALTVIPVERAPREPDAVMPAFEQVNVNEHFGMHFLME